MQAWVVEGAGSPADALVRREVGPPDPPPGFVRLRVDMAGLGLPDVLMCRGTYPLTPPVPFTPGQEVVGVVTAVGEQVDPAFIGTRQMGVTAFYVGSGGFAEETLMAEATMFPAPPTLDDAAAAGFHIPFLTGWNALVDRARVAAGETIVVLGAAGGSGSAAVLLAGSLGVRAIAVAGGGAKVDHCKELGAAEVIDHHEVDVAEAIRELTDGRGADVVFDPVGGQAGEGAAGALASGGRMLLVGFASGTWPLIDPATLVSGNLSLLGVYAGAYDRNHALKVYSDLFARLRGGTLTGLPTQVVDFDDIPHALTQLADRATTGKMVARVNGAT